MTTWQQPDDGVGTHATAFTLEDLESARARSYVPLTRSPHHAPYGLWHRAGPCDRCRTYYGRLVWHYGPYGAGYQCPSCLDDQYEEAASIQRSMI